MNYHLCDYAEVKSPQNTEFLDSLYYLLKEVHGNQCVLDKYTETNLLFMYLFIQIKYFKTVFSKWHF